MTVTSSSDLTWNWADNYKIDMQGRIWYRRTYNENWIRLDAIEFMEHYMLRSEAAKEIAFKEQVANYIIKLHEVYEQVFPALALDLV